MKILFTLGLLSFFSGVAIAIAMSEEPNPQKELKLEEVKIGECLDYQEFPGLPDRKCKLVVHTITDAAYEEGIRIPIGPVLCGDLTCDRDKSVKSDCWSLDMFKK